MELNAIRLTAVVNDQGQEFLLSVLTTASLALLACVSLA